MDRSLRGAGACEDIQYEPGREQGSGSGRGHLDMSRGVNRSLGGCRSPGVQCFGEDMGMGGAGAWEGTARHGISMARGRDHGGCKSMGGQSLGVGGAARQGNGMAKEYEMRHEPWRVQEPGRDSILLGDMSLE